MLWSVRAASSHKSGDPDNRDQITNAQHLTVPTPLFTFIYKHLFLVSLMWPFLATKWGFPGGREEAAWVQHEIRWCSMRQNALCFTLNPPWCVEVNKSEDTLSPTDCCVPKHIKVIVSLLFLPWSLRIFAVLQPFMTLQMCITLHSEAIWKWNTFRNINTDAKVHLQKTCLAHHWCRAALPMC